jgi:hypothetical protein
MEVQLAKSLLRGRNGSFVASEPTGVSLQQQRAFLFAINSILTKREANYALIAEISGEECDAGSLLAKDVEEWADCLNR